MKSFLQLAFCCEKAQAPTLPHRRSHGIDHIDLSAVYYRYDLLAPRAEDQPMHTGAIIHGAVAAMPEYDSSSVPRQLKRQVYHPLFVKLLQKDKCA